MNEENGKMRLHVQVARIEECIGNLRDEIRGLKENHVNHINQRLDSMDKSISDLRVGMARWGGGLATALAIVEIILRFGIK